MASQETSPIKFALGMTGLMPQEEKLASRKGSKKLVISVPKEKENFENRVCLTPEAVEILVNMGHEIMVESGAGAAANYSDLDYSDRGGIIMSDKTSIYQADIILKVAPPSIEEIDMMKGRQYILSTLSSNLQTEEYIRKLMEKKVTAIAFENIKDETGCYPVVRSMSSLEGTSSILVAAEYLSTSHKGKGVMLGGLSGITPTEVVIIGAGTAAEFAVKAATGLGAFVKVFDNSVHGLVQLQNNVGVNLYTSVFHPSVLDKALKSADVVIGARQSLDSGPRFYITEKMVRSMKKGSVIVDISIPYGGCIETSEARPLNDPVYTKYGIIHYSVASFSSRVSRTASIGLSNVFLPVLLKTADAGGMPQMLRMDSGFRNGIYIFNGILTNHYIAKHFGIPSKDIDLLMAAF